MISVNPIPGVGIGSAPAQAPQAGAVASPYMQPAQPTPSQPSQTQSTQLDPQVVALSKAIINTESGGNYNAKGASGEFGAAQWLPQTWSAQAKQILGDPNAPMTPANQKAVLYGVLYTDKQQGLNPAQIASKWNSGDSQAYTGTFSSGGSSIGTNKMGVAYNVPQYVQSVTNAYQQYIKGNQNPTITPNASTAPAAPSVGGFLSNLVSSAGNVASGIGSAIMHPLNTIKTLAQGATGAAEDLGNTAGFTSFQNTPSQQVVGSIGTYFKSRYGGSTPSQVAHNIVATAYKDPVGVALDLSTLLSGAGGALGVAGDISDVSKAATLANAVPDLSDAGKAAMIASAPEGALSRTAGVLSKAGELTNPITPVGKAIGSVIPDAISNLPNRIVNSILPQLKQSDTLDYAVSHIKLGKVDSMVESSQQAMDSYNNQIDAVLSHPDYAEVPVNGENIVKTTLSQFPNSEYSEEDIFNKMRAQLPAQAKVFTKLENGESISLQEANTLRKSIDRITYKNTIDSPEVKANKDVAAAFGNSLRNTVQDTAKETQPIFDNYSKEINVYRALKKLATKENKSSLISLKDLLSANIGTGIAGIPGAAAGIIGDKVLSSPAVGLAGAKLAKTAAGVVSPVLKTAGEVLPKVAQVVPRKTSQ